MAEDRNKNKEMPWQVIFTWKDKENNKMMTIGPVTETAKTERMAILKAALSNHKELLKDDIFSLDVTAKLF